MVTKPVFNISLLFIDFTM